MSDVQDDFKIVVSVLGSSPTSMIRRLEQEITGAHGDLTTVTATLKQASISEATLLSVLNIKETVGQLNVVVHALGILVALPRVLEADETVETVSLGAGNTGKTFDLVTSHRVAEFKFIHWRGGAESIRQNSVFKDFLNLLWDTSGKSRFLYLMGTDRALRFLRGGRALSSVLKDNPTRVKFEARYGSRYRTVWDFYREHEGQVYIEDLSKIVPNFRNREIGDD